MRITLKISPAFCLFRSASESVFNHGVPFIVVAGMPVTTTSHHLMTLSPLVVGTTQQ